MSHLTPLRLSAAVVALFTSSGVFAIDVPDPGDLTIGKWELNHAKSKFCGAAPKKSTREIYNVGFGWLVVVWTGINADGGPINDRYVMKYDEQKLTSTIERVSRDTVSYKQVSPARVEWIHWSIDNKPTSHQYREVSGDGQSMAQVAHRVDSDCVASQIFDRQPFDHVTAKTAR